MFVCENKQNTTTVYQQNSIIDSSLLLRFIRTNKLFRVPGTDN